MKYLSLLLLTFLCHFAVAQVTPKTGVAIEPPVIPLPAAVPAEAEIPKTTIEWLEPEFQFGTIKQGDKVEHVFKFKNTGKNPLIISSAKGSCGCTVPEYSKEPLAPGKIGEMKVVFNSAGKMGQQSKPVTVLANTEPNSTRVTLNGMVEQPAGTPAPTPAPAAVDHGDHKHPHEATAASAAKPNKAAAMSAKPSKTQENATNAKTTAAKPNKTTVAATAEKVSAEADKAAQKADKAKKAAEKAAKKAEKAAAKAKKAAEKAAKKAQKAAAKLTTTK